LIAELGGKIMSINNAIFQMMADLGSEQFNELLESPQRFRLYLQREYLPFHEPPMPPDPLAAMELAQLEEQMMISAAYVWWKLQEPQREQLLQVLRSVGGDSEDLQEALDQHLPN
jgi:hypothetical protein